jgi:Na+:H+ antiporter, NhaA family
MRDSDGHSMLEKAEHGLAPWSAYLVVPIFGFANAGVHFLDMGIEQVFAPLPLAIATGLFVGKQLGIFTIIVVAVKLGIARKPENASWMEIWGVSILTGIGFTMSLFISELAFQGNRLFVEEAKIGILLGSIVSAVIGYIALRITTTHPEEKQIYEDARSNTP